MTRTTVDSGKGTAVEGQATLGFLTKGLVNLELQAGDKVGVISELVGLLADKSKIDKKDREAVTQAILKRESLGSTGIGGGLAIPHAKASPHVKDIVGAFGRSPKKIEFGAVDGEPCDLFFLMISPQNEVNVKRHLDILKQLAKLQRNPNFCRFLRAAKDEDELIALVKEAEER